MAETKGKTLLELGPGVGSSVEHIKLRSCGLRGNLREELARDTTHFSENDVQLLKFHGSYQQEDRGLRRARKAEGLGPAYSMMLRLRIPAGALDAKQYLALDELADRYGNGTLRFTTRQSIQFHGILKGDLWGAIHDINETLLSTRSACGDVNRNVMACPAPLQSRAALGIGDLAEDIAKHLAPRSSSYHEIWIDGERVTDRQLAANALSPIEPEAHAPQDEPIYGPTYLPRKFKIGIAYPGDNCIDVFTQDIGLIAETRDEAGQEQLGGFNVMIGGGMGMTHGKPETHPAVALPFAFVTPEETIEVITAIVTVQRDYGDRTNRKRARMKYVVEERGIPWFREEVEQRIGRRLEDPHQVVFDDVCDHLGWHEQPDGLWFLGISVENGRVHDIDRRASANRAGDRRLERPLALRSGLRTVLAQIGCSLRITPQQNVLLCDIPAARRDDVERVLQQHGIIVDPARLGMHRYAMACPALPTCGLALTDAERTLPDLIDRLQGVLNELGAGSERLSVRMTGCPNGCARPYMGDIGIVGRSLNLYDVFVGGDWENTRLNRVAFQKVTSEDLVPTLRPAIERWIRDRNVHETFGDYYHRIGFDALANCGRWHGRPHSRKRKDTALSSGFTVWLTGLSGAGKSTISRALVERLRERGRNVEVLDGDEVRENLSKGLGFSREDRDTNIARIAYVAHLLSRNDVVTITAAISPYAQAREAARQRIGTFVEVYVKCSLEELQRRDVKGLYAKAIAGEIKNFTGVSDPYEPPEQPEVLIDTERETVDESIAKIVAHLERAGYLTAEGAIA